MMPVADHAAFILANTAVLKPPLVPEIRLHLACEAVPLWIKTEEELGELGLPPPFWAFAWAGGQALARYILDHADIVRNKSVLDLASGSGLVAIAAAQAGATRILAADIDSFSTSAIAMNAAVNNVTIEIASDDMLEQPPPETAVILVGDLFYERDLASRVLVWLREAVRQGTQVFIGDPGRSYLPRSELRRLVGYNVPVTRDLEDTEIKHTAVWVLK